MPIKLVRDKIPDKVFAAGGSPRVFHPDDLARNHLYLKLIEEILEYQCSGDPLELRDVYEVILALWKRHGRTEVELIEAAMIKRDDVGSFDTLVLMEVPD